MQTAAAIVAIVAAGLAASCSSSSSAGGGEPDATVVCSTRASGPCGEGETTRWVLDSLAIPATQDEAGALAMDIDGDDREENMLGALLAADGNAEATAATNDAVRRGDIIQLAELVAPTLTTATGVGFTLFSGTNPSVLPCDGDDDPTCGRHLGGDAHFDIEDDRSSPFVGHIVGGRLSADLQGQTHLDVVLFASGPTVRLPLLVARVEAQVAEDGIADGRIGGAIRETDYRATVIPALALQLDMVIAADCELATCECTAGSSGETIVNLVDADGSCSIAPDELIAVQQFGPDLDLFDDDGLPGPDGRNDSRSFAFGFTAVPASF